MITAILLVACVLLAGAVVALVVSLRRLERRLVGLESRGLVTGASAPSSTSESAGAPSSTSDPLVEEVAQQPSRDQASDYVITRLGEPEAVPTLETKLFADFVLRESVVKAASWAYGVRRALSPENRNRIRFEMRREVKRARKSRRAEEREAIREWRARRRDEHQADAA